MTDVTISVLEGNGVKYGLLSTGSGTIRINHSVVKASLTMVIGSAGITTYVANSQLVGPMGYNAGTIACVGAYRRIPLTPARVLEAMKKA